MADHGPNPYVVDIEKATLDNEAFRDTLWTGKFLQLTVMTIPPGGEIGAEIHDEQDKIQRHEEGELRAMNGASEDDLEVDEVIKDDWAAFVPGGKWHNFVNESDKPAKLYSIYAPPEHKPGTRHETKADADNDPDEHGAVFVCYILRAYSHAIRHLCLRRPSHAFPLSSQRFAVCNHRRQLAPRRFRMRPRARPVQPELF